MSLVKRFGSQEFSSSPFMSIIWIHVLDWVIGNSIIFYNNQVSEIDETFN